MKTKRLEKNKHWKEIGEERISHLFGLAEKEFKSHPERADRYVGLARKIAMRYNIRLTSYKKSFCPKCYAYLVPGRNATVRTRSSQRAVIHTCHTCKHVSRHPYRKEKLKSKKRQL
ncbi:MAG: ribonuclease P [Candidatus Aenigmatarchaeota archaeon]|nr:ribonuclease P [Nanoarchaeota archaeon]